MMEFKSPTINKASTLKANISLNKSHLPDQITAEPDILFSSTSLKSSQTKKR